MEKTKIEEQYYIKGVSEGFFEVQLTNTENITSNLNKSYEEGRKIGNSRADVKRSFDFEEWNNNRNKYIEIQGYTLGIDQEDEKLGFSIGVTTRYLSSGDKDIFVQGLKRAKKELRRREESIDNRLEKIRSLKKKKSMLRK